MNENCFFRKIFNQNLRFGHMYDGAGVNCKKNHAVFLEIDRNKIIFSTLFPKTADFFLFYLPFSITDRKIGDKIFQKEMLLFFQKTAFLKK